MLSCTDVGERNLIERYVAGTATATEVRSLEDHFVTCPRCQAEVKLATAIRASLPHVGARPQRRWWPHRAWAAPAVAVAAVLVAIVILPRTPAKGVAALGLVTEPPAYLGIAVRGTRSPADSLFGAGMTAYVEARYATAASALQEALATGADSLPAQFFHATSLLMLGQAGDAAAEYETVILQGDSPYLPEAHYYRAKALLQLGRPSDALADLDAAGALGGIPGAHADALADSVRQWLGR